MTEEELIVLIPLCVALLVASFAVPFVRALKGKPNKTTSTLDRMIEAAEKSSGVSLDPDSENTHVEGNAPTNGGRGDGGDSGEMSWLLTYRARHPSLLCVLCVHR